MDDLTIQQFTAAEWKELEQQTGGTLVRSEHVFRLPPFPAAGYWLKLGDRSYMVSTREIVNTPTKPSDTSNYRFLFRSTMSFLTQSCRRWILSPRARGRDQPSSSCFKNSRQV